MEDMVIIAAIVVGMLVFLTIGAIVSSSGDKKRTQAFEREAARMGFAYDPAAVPVYGMFDDMHLMNQGHSKKAQRLLTNGSGTDATWLFDYRYLTGYGKDSHTHHHTVVAFPNLESRLPEFQLRPENFLHKIGAKLGYQDIDFDEHPEFSSRYLLRGQEVLAVRALFKPACIETLMGMERICVEGAGTTLFVYRTKRVKPEKLSELIDEARTVREAITGERGHGRGVRSRLT